MTRIEIKKIIEVLIAYAEGKALQAKPIGSKDSRWEDVTGDCDFHNPFWEFRVKPEPKLVPFTFEDALLFRDKWITDKLDTYCKKIDTYGKRGVTFKNTNDTCFVEYKKFLEFYKFADTGEPCGKIVEE